MNFKTSAIILLVTVLTLAVAAGAQTSATGALTGTVIDPSGAVVPGAKITIVHPATGAKREVTTDSAGVFRASLLPPGTYNVQAAAEGFKTQGRSDIVLNVTETVTVAITLEVGTRTESVTVEANAELIQTQTTTLGRVVGELAVQNLPLTNRNYTQILALSAGVAAPVTNAAGLGRNTQEVNVNGGRVMDNTFQMDGVEVTNNQTGRAGSVVGASGIAIPNPDAIQEFKVQTSLYDAGYGRGSGANVNVVTKSGTNSLHGAVFEFFRNEKLNANDFFRNRNGQGRPIFKQNQFGFTLGGPLKKDKLFFFGSYQGSRQVNGASSSSLKSSFLPPISNDRSAATLGRQFGGLRGANGGVTVAADGSNISPVALKLLNAKLPDGTFFIPTPQVIQSNGLGFSVFSIPSRATEDQFIFNMDYLISPKHSLSGRYFFSREPQIASFTGSTVPGSPIANYFTNYVAVLRLTSSLTPTVLNEATVSFHRNYGRIDTLTPVKSQDIGMTPSSDDPVIPVISVSGLFTLGGTRNDGQFIASNTLFLGDQVSWARGKHSVRTGFGYEGVGAPFADPAIARGEITIRGFPDFLLGMSAAQNGTQFSNIQTSTGRSGNTNRQFRVKNYSSFIQDDYKLHPRLTLNLGLRWEIFGQVSDTTGRLVNFWPLLGDNNFSSGPTYSGLVAASNFKGDLPAGVKRNDSKTVVMNAMPLANFGPRIGLAWQPLARTNRLVIRAGYGLFYTRTPVNDMFQLIINPPFFQTVTLTGVQNGAATFQVPFNPPPPAVSAFPLWFPRSTTTTPQNLSIVGQDWKLPRTHQWSFNIQHELLRDIMLEVAYVGKRGERIEQTRGINQPRLASPENPINGQTTNTLANVSLRVPFLGYATGGLSQRENYGFSYYHALQTSITKRFSHGLEFQGAYTWGKGLTTAGGLGGFGTGGGGYTGSVYNIHQMYGPTDYDRQHRFVFNYVWQLPAWQKGSGFFGKVTSGWQLSGVTTIQSGLALTIVDARAGSIYNASGQRAQICPGLGHADLVTSGSVTSRLGGYFNKAAICAPPTVGNGTGFGNLGRGVVRGPGQQNFDLALAKRTNLPWREGMNLEFRTEFFNIFNSPVFDNPGVNAANADFGLISAASVTPRLVQFALKLNF